MIDLELDVENCLSADHELAVAHEYDTADRDLEQIGVQVSRLPLEAGVVWRLTLPRGERVEVWTAGTEGLSLPDEIAQLIGGIVAGKRLVPAAPLSDDPGAKRLRAGLLEQRHKLLEHEPGVRLGADTDNLRKHRVAARRARAFLRATRRYSDPAWRRAIAGPLTELGVSTGRLRDLDVLLDGLQTELAQLDPLDRAGGALVVDALEHEREQAHRALLETLDGDGYRAVLGRLRHPPRLRPGSETIPLAKVARREFQRLGNRVRHLGDDPDETALHALRIALKRSRYAAELSAPSGKRLTRFLVDAKALQDLLGAHQDAAVAEQRLRAATVVDSPTSAAFVAGRLAERRRTYRATITEQLPAAWRRLRRSGSHLA